MISTTVSNSGAIPIRRHGRCDKIGLNEWINLHSTPQAASTRMAVTLMPDFKTLTHQRRMARM